MAKKKTFKIVLAIVLLLIIAAGGVLGYAWYMLKSPNIITNNDEKIYIYIYDNYDFEDLIRAIEKEAEIKNINSFRKTAELLKYTNIRPGKYEINRNTSNIDFIRKLRSGDQTPVRLTFNNIRTKEQLAGRLAQQIMADSLDILYYLENDDFLAGYNLNPKTSVIIFIPNTYEVFWNISGKDLFDRMYREYNHFWTENRRKKADKIPLSIEQVSILASIVEEETKKEYEYPTVAGVYINRLKKGMRLEADPTVKFAAGDFALRRVLHKHLATDSPYNTYMYGGLPPGPIRIPSPQVIDGVLNYERHNYIFMVAKETLNGEHNFSTTNAEHERHAKKYRQALNELGIFR
jgi:UPF0755 protein